jgi:uncharacterized protein YbbC (DUF1343 family)
MKGATVDQSIAEHARLDRGTSPTRASGFLSSANLSVGVAPTVPFEQLGAPYIDDRRLSSILNLANLPGVRFVPVRFTPHASVFKEQECGGVRSS